MLQLVPMQELDQDTKLKQDLKLEILLKQKKLKKNIKVNHLSYIGDTDVGDQSSIGAGTIHL